MKISETQAAAIIEKCKRAKTTFEFVTPEIAAKMLEANTGNYRPASESTTRRYVTDIESGLWTYTTASVSFTESGVLIDGQHRLGAIVQSGVGLWLFVMRGLPEELLSDPNQDKGKMRKVATFICRNGCKHATTVSGALRCLYRIADGRSTIRSGRTGLTDAQVLNLCDFMPSVFFQAVSDVACNSNAKKTYHPSMSSAVFYLMRRHDESSASEFFGVYTKSIEESSMHPANVLREQVVSNRKLIDNNKFLSLSMTAFALHLKGEQRKVLRTFDSVAIPSGSQKALDEVLEILSEKEVVA